MEQISKALVKAQSQMSNAKKDAKNPFFKSTYADLNSVREAVLPVLNENGIAVLQPIVNLEGKNYVKTVLLHESGESIESFTEIVYSKANDAQSQGSGISYARRYGLQSFVCIGAEDDDGNSASKQATPKVSVEDAVKEMESVTTIDQLKSIWTNYKQFQGDKSFVYMKDKRKHEIE